MATYRRAISNEEIIAALLDSGTVKEAAEKLRLSPRTLYERMNNSEFRVAYNNATADIVRQAVFSINSKLTAAVEEVSQIMSDKNVNAAVRLQAAQTIISNAGKFADRLTKAEQSATPRSNNDVFELLDWLR